MSDQNTDKLPLEISTWLTDFESFVNDEMTRNGAAPPIDETLFHYTTMSGALGILSSGNFWFTEKAHLNDPLEIKYGIEEALRLFETIDMGEWHEVFRTHLRDGFTTTLKTMAFYIASFSLDGDSLPQWRSYADDGHGIALGFSPTAFEAVDSGSKPLSFPSFRMKYEAKALQNLQEIPLKEAIKYFDRHKAKFGATHHEALVKSVVANVALLLLFNSLLFKHPAYASEQEFRLISMGNRDWFLKHPIHRMRARRDGIIHYLERKIEPPLKAEGALREIRVGPCSSPSTVDQFRDVLVKLGINGVPITQSQIPYKSIRS